MITTGNAVVQLDCNLSSLCIKSKTILSATGNAVDQLDYNLSSLCIKSKTILSA